MDGRRAEGESFAGSGSAECVISGVSVSWRALPPGLPRNTEYLFEREGGAPLAAGDGSAFGSRADFAFGARVSRLKLALQNPDFSPDLAYYFVGTNAIPQDAARRKANEATPRQ